MVDNTRSIRRKRLFHCIIVIAGIIFVIPTLYMYHQITTGINVNITKISSFTGITFPSDSRLIGARYRGGWQDSILLARIEINSNEMEKFIQALSKSMIIKRFETPILKMTPDSQDRYQYEYERNEAIRSMTTGRDPEWWNPESISSFIYMSKLTESESHSTTRMNVVAAKNADSLFTVYILKIN